MTTINLKSLIQDLAKLTDDELNTVINAALVEETERDDDYLQFLDDSSKGGDIL